MLYIQTNLYEFLNLFDDPVFNKLKNLLIDEEIQIDSFTIRKTNKFYEVENEEMHEAFESLDECYSFLSTHL